MIPRLPPGLTVGEYAPWFTCETPNNPKYAFQTVAGRHVLLGFLPPDPAMHQSVGRALQAHRAAFDDRTLTLFLAIRDAGSIAQARNQLPGLRWFLDRDGSVTRLYGGEAGLWVLLDPALRIARIAPMAETASVFAQAASLPPPDASGVAPALIVPRVFEPGLCETLIAYYEARGGQPSGVMRDVAGRTVGVLDPMKRRRDVAIEDPELRQQIRLRMVRRLGPELKRAYGFEATRLERYVVACYDAEEGGFFNPHRDNETLGTAHRRFAASINLNAEGFEGGDLRFPEFGARTYRPPTGGAVVFSCSMLHEATPVTRGRRYAFLPFLYDEAGAAVREANRGALAVD
jgi:predicted 2-oxoglutarate/Fe(II)-dependent dioxygenase YbiX